MSTFRTHEHETKWDYFGFTGADYSRAYIDVKDAQWLCNGKLQPTDINSISPSQFVIYQFGSFVIRLLHETVNTPQVTLLLASNLPPNDYDHNCFRNSFFYEHARKILFVRRERLESIGDFIVLIVHCVAHINTGNLTDDANPMFLQQFYKVGWLEMGTLCRSVGICTCPNNSNLYRLNLAIHYFRSKRSGKLMFSKLTIFLD